MSIFHRRPKAYRPEIEIDIENNPVLSIDRRGVTTIISFTNGLKTDYLGCSLDEHKRLVARFRRKLGIADDNQKQNK